MDDRFDKLLPVSEVKKQLGVSLRLVYQLIYDRKLPHVRIGRAVRVRESALREFIERSTVGAFRDV